MTSPLPTSSTSSTSPASSTQEYPTHQLPMTVQIFDTDCFGVVWHGAYTKWLEMGRVQLLETMGIILSKPNDPEGYIYPVVDQHFRFKASARMQDPLVVETTMAVAEPRLVFTQEVRHQETGKVMITCTTTCVVLDSTWKTQRRLPEALRSVLLGGAGSPD